MIAQHPELIKTFDGRYTTQAALARELATIKLMQQGKGQVRPIAESAFVESYLEGKKLTSGQREAIALTATTADQFIAWQGVAGAGKTYALNELKQITQVLKGVAEGHEIKILAGFAPSAAATKVLGKELGIEANTVASLLVSKEPEEIQPKQLWIVDEAGMLSAKDGYALLQRATAERARVILVGDTRQMSAVEAGNPFKSLQQAGISTAHLNESLRQKVPDLKKAVDLAAAGCHVQALHHLKSVGRLQEISDTEDRAVAIAQNYLQITPDKRQSTLVIAGTHKEKASIMQEIRQGLKQEGILALEDIHLTRLKEKDLTTVQSRYLHYYDKGDVVVPVREYKRAGLHKNKPYFVEGFQADKLVLKDLSNNQIVVDPMKFRKSVYTQQKIAVSVGERLLWTKGDKQIGRSNRDEFVVTAIEGRTATIRYKDAREEFLYLDQPLPLDYAIVSTTYSSQAKTADRVLISSTSDRTVSQESVYVAISRAKHDLQIFAEDQEFLFEQAEESNAQETVLELLQPQPSAQATQSAPARVKQGAKVKVVSLPGPEKGVDDFIVANSPLAYERQNLAALELQQWRAKSKQQRQTVEPPKKLSVKERKEKLKDKLDLQHPISKQHPVKPEEQTHDFNSQQLKTEPTADGQQGNSENYSATKRQDHALRNEQQPTERENRAFRVKPQSTERENSSSRSQPDREPERTESQLHGLLEAISGYLELQEIEQLGDDIERISCNRAGQYLRGERKQGVARAVERQDPEGPDSPASDGSVERQGGDFEQRAATKQLLSAISGYLEAAALAESPVADNLLSLAENLNFLCQHRNIDGVKQPERAITLYQQPEILQQALVAIAEFVEESCIESALTGTVESVINQLSSYHQHSISSKEAKNGNLEQLSTDQVTSDQAIDAISTYVKQQEVLGATTTQDLEMLEEQLGSQRVAASNQQITPVSTEYVAPTDYEQTTQRAMDAIARYIEAQTIEAVPLEQNLEALTLQFSQPASQEFAQRLQQAARNVDPQTTAVKKEALLLQTGQLLKAITDYVEVAAVKAALAQPLESLLQGLNQRQAPSINKGQKNNPYLKAIADCIEQEAVEEVLPALENLAGELNTLRSSESIAPVTASPNPDISKLVLDSITGFIEQTAVESEITESLEDLTAELKRIQPGISIPFRKLDTVISHLLQQLEALVARKQQEIIASSVEAIMNHVEQSTVENALNPQVLKTLSKQLSQQSDPDLSVVMQQLEAIIADYQTRLQAQILTPAAEAITHYCEQEAVSEALTQDINLLVQNLSLTNKSQLPNQLQQLSEVIEQYYKHLEAQQTMNPTVIDSVVPRPLKKVSSNRSRVKNDPKAFESLASSVREIPLEDVAESLGLVRDRHDKHKWRGEGQIISINNQKFYDHSLQKGGYGAIDLVIHVQRQSFKGAVNWLSNGTSYVLPAPIDRAPQPKVPLEHQPFQPPVPDENKWQEVRQYLVEGRGLPERLVDELHFSGKIYAAGLEPDTIEKLHSKGCSHPENITNAVFLRQDLEQKPTGASLRGASDNSQFKGLAPGSHRDDGWFSFTQGEGQLERIVLVESPIDALSAAALAKHPGKTLLMSTDGAGSVPVGWLRQQQAQGVQVIAAHDADRAGEEMAWRLATEVPAINRATPTRGKDWNEQLKSERQPNQAEIPLDPSEWQRVAQAIGKTEAYINRVKAVTRSGKALPEQAKSSMQQNFHAHKQTSTDLWQWHQAAKTLGESEAYLKRIADVAIAFHHPKQPIPLPQKAITIMRKDLVQYEQLLTHKQWQHYSHNADSNHPMKTAFIVALAAMKDGHTPEKIHKILEHDPFLVKIRQRRGEQAAQNHLKIAIRNTKYRMQPQNQSPQVNQQQPQHKQNPSFEV